MNSKRSHEGLLIVDNRNLALGVGSGVAEIPTFTCSHCQAIVVLNARRTRERGYCRKCDHCICDHCLRELSASGICKPFKEIVYDALVAADKAATQGMR